MYICIKVTPYPHFYDVTCISNACITEENVALLLAYLLLTKVRWESLNHKYVHRLLDLLLSSIKIMMS